MEQVIEHLEGIKWALQAIAVCVGLIALVQVFK